MVSALDRAQGVLYGQAIGDNLGASVEFRSPEAIKEMYPDGIRELQDGGAHNIIAGQPTDDTEMALVLAHSIVRNDGYDVDDVREAYRKWARSEPVDIGATVSSALLRDRLDETSQANGALMRVSPLGIFASRFSEAEARELAVKDCLITHPHHICQEVNQAYVVAIAAAIRDELSAEEVLELLAADPSAVVRELVAAARAGGKRDLMFRMKSAKNAFFQAVWELAHGDSFEDAVVHAISLGGDTDSNGAVCGSLLGAVYGVDAIPERWRKVVDACEPGPGTLNPRSEEYWPRDLSKLAEQLLG
ncbi:ADP-ribosylglycohydrolase family protein [Corynebacterium canis]|uniref:ADP-ribosylglycohydrolase family protein n=1 Tax=Corynebacterium canis TaxID=679663 RepID=A0A5C5UQP4_9CORY|nr:ADP-ribosylglycohydrolase family protein [Corynebacterium canis]TWT28496.1 ADP-ribosylglycohydrolase family protein [Corynebacterium canis]WJY75918.1 ADP-ribosyl-[dinitrogen reductase] glycohydrolase [Corynebacterium canis]